MLKNRRWSILLWSVFLVIFISFSFLYISTQINKKIKLSQNENIFSNSKEQTIKIFQNSFSGIIKKGEKINFSFTKTNSWNINLISWWPIYYEIFENLEIKENDIINTSKNIANFYSWITLSTLWWLSKFEINFSSEEWIVFPYNYIKTTKNIWWNEMIKEVFLED